MSLKKPQFAHGLFSQTDFYLKAMGKREAKPSRPSLGVLKETSSFLGESTAKSTREGVKVLFLASHFQSQGARDMVDKMAEAMSLSSKEAVVLVVEEGEKRDKLIHQIYATRAPYVVAFGAFVGNLLLQTNKRLTDLRGRFYIRAIENPEHSQQNLSVKILTVFHPNFLLVNPSLKAAAWSDLQLIINDENSLSR